MDTKHTPLPWRVDVGSRASGTSGALVRDQNNLVVCEAWPTDPNGAVQRENAAFIVRACNAYDKDQETIRELVVALEEIARFPYQPENKGMLFPDAMDRMEDIAHAAIAKATGA